MRFYTAHVRPDREPVLVRDGFSWGACLFGPFWLAGHGAWLAALLVAAGEAAIALLAHGALGVALSVWGMWVAGLVGQDLRRWTLMHRGYGEAHVVAARDETAALGRLFAARPDLIGAGL